MDPEDKINVVTNLMLSLSRMYVLYIKLYLQLKYER